VIKEYQQSMFDIKKEKEIPDKNLPIIYSLASIFERACNIDLPFFVLNLHAAVTLNMHYILVI
jgi:hypothetical protein